MDSARWQHLKQVLDQAIDLPESERPRFLDRSCGPDHDLRAELESLLRHHRVSNPLDQTAAHYAAPLLLDPPPKTLGAYRIVSHIGLGGSSDVYLAARADGHFEKQVAVKILRSGIYGDDMRRRFQRERQILADLDHPHIVRLLDGGITPDGRPYLVEEHVDGPPVTAFAHAKQLSLPPRLDLFLSICEAVAYAHRCGVVHRDLKPSNILTTAEGVPKLVDFGVAGLLDASGAGPQATISQLRYWTPAYSSPEHALGAPIGPASDVYSLGLILYELLLGRPALDLHTAHSRIQVDALPRPLRAIAARCLQKNAAGRYPDAGALLDALRGLSGSRLRLPRWNVRRLLYRMAAVTSAILFVAAAWVGWPWRNGPLQEPSSSRGSLITSGPAFEQHVSLSPDGAFVVYSVREGEGLETSSLYLKPVGGGAARHLTSHSANDRWPRWSPNGAAIAFARVDADEIDIYAIPPAAGPEQRIAHLNHPGSHSNGDVNWVAWTADGKSLILVDRPSRSAPLTLYLMPLDTRNRRQLTHPPHGSVGDIDAAASPDGRSIAFVRRNRPYESDLFVISLEGGTPRRLTSDRVSIRGLAWTPDGKDIVFSSRRMSALTTLWRVPASGDGFPSRIGGGIDESVWPSVAKSPAEAGFRIAYQAVTNTVNLMQWEISRRPESKPAPVCPSSRHDWQAQLSPDGRSVAFSSTRNGSSNIWICGPGGQERQITSFSGAYTDSPRWSPDGRSLLFTSSGMESREVFLAELGTGQLRPLTSDPSDEGRASFSRDGRWIYFRSDRSGRNEIWKMPSGGGPARQITRTGAMEGFESPDGKSLYFVRDRPQLGVWSVPAEGGGEIFVADGVRDTRWGVSRNGIHFVTVKPPFDIMNYRFDTRKTERAYRIPGSFTVWAGFTVSLDGKVFLWPQSVRDSSDIAILQGVK